MEFYKKIVPSKNTRTRIMKLFGFIPDKIVLKLQFKMKMGKSLNLKNPKTLNEKLQWLKLYDRKPIYTKMVDKYEAKKFIVDQIGEDYIIPTLGVWDKFEDINFDELPNRFVLKCTHNSGGVIICKDKSKLDLKEASRKITDCLKANYYYLAREWPYKNVKPRIIAEKYMGDESGKVPDDYKFFCFDGYVDSVMICTDRETDKKRFYFFDREWNLRKYNKSSQELPDDFKIDKPDVIEDLFNLAEKLSKGKKFIRIDFYIVDNKPYFGELTFFPSGGYDYNIVPWADEYLGEKVKL